MLVCETTRKGKKCTFMTAQGCSFNGGSCAEIIEACNGCARSEQQENGWFCTAFPDPSVMMHHIRDNSIPLPINVQLWYPHMDALAAVARTSFVPLALLVVRAPG
ncbi:MAG: PxxKW family cysteine-rich protein, partial [Desulfosalsimonadaceae bacterium]